MLQVQRYIILLYFLLSYCITYGQNASISQRRSLGLPDGISTRWAKCITEDHNKLIWVGTVKGISRYNGFQFLNFNTANSNLRNESIYSILRDSLGYLWASDKMKSTQFSSQDYNSYGFNTPITIDLIDPLTLEIKSFDEHFKSAPFRESDIRITEETKYGIWIGTFDHRYFLYDGTFHPITTGSQHAKYQYLTLKDKHTFWGIKGDTLHILDKSGDPLYQSIIPEGSILLEAKTIGKKLWLVYVSKEEDSFKIYKFSENNKLEEILHSKPEGFLSQHLFSIINPFQVIQNSESKYFIRLGNLSFTYDSNPMNQSTQDHLPQYSNYWYQDSNNNLWYNHNEEIWVASKSTNYFTSYLNNSPTKLETRGIYALDNNELLVSSYKGTFQLKRNINEKGVLITDHIATVNRIIRYDKDTFFAAGQMSGIYKFQLNKVNNPELIKPSNQVVTTTTLIKDRSQESIWIGTFNGLMKYDIESNQLETSLKINQDSLFGQSEITDFHFSDQGLWISTLQGLFLTNPDSAIIKSYLPSTGFPFSRIQHIYDDGGFFWLATNGHGLIRFNPKSEEYQRFTLKDGLSNNYIHATYEDKDGFLWMPSDYGLMRMNKATNEIITYTASDGLNTNEFNRFSHSQDDTGKLIFGSIDGIIEFSPEEINKSPKSNHNILFTKIDVFNENDDLVYSHLDDYRKNKSITINPSDTYINVEFTVTDFTKENNYQFGYQIEGLDKSWKHTKNHNLEIGRLPYGDFTLRIKGQGQGGNWASKTLSLDIHVLRPFHKTWAFTIAMLLLGTGLIFLGVRYRLSILRKNNIRLQSEVQARTVELQEVNKSKDKLFGILAHDLRGPISSFKNLSKKVQYLISNKDWDTLDKMTNQIDDDTTRLDQLISNLLPWVLVQSKNPEIVRSKVKLFEIVEQTIDQLANNIRDKNISVSNGINKSHTVIADAIAIEIIVRNLLSNAIKYSQPNHKIEISASSKDNFITLAFKDYGSGMNPAALAEIFSEYTSEPGTAGEKGHGLGLKLSRDLAVRNGGSLHISSEEGIGTVASLKIPKN